MIEEVEGDLFECLNDTNIKSLGLCHCVSQDFAMGAGIAVEFKKRFGRVEELVAQKPAVGSGAFVVHETPLSHIFYLVTKGRYYQKPTYQTLRNSIVWLKKEAEAKGVTLLCMPRIGCGLDLLEWDKVRAILVEVFENSETNIRVYKK